jgi:hypothetical protein
VQGRQLSLAFAYAASEAYEHADENRELIDRVVRSLGERVALSEPAFEELVSRFFAVIDSNRTAPSVVRVMAFADEARVCRAEAANRATHGWRRRRTFRKQSDRAMHDLTEQVAQTLDGLLTEKY